MARGNRKVRKILIVDNQPLIVDFFEHLLRHEGFEVKTARDGLGALRELDQSVPDLLVTDLVMPNIDGAHLCRIVRSQKRFDKTYVVVLSAIAAEEHLDLKTIGANACIAKGPLTSMKRHLLSILSDVNLDPMVFDSGQVFGIDEIFERSITRELLATTRHAEVVLENQREGIIEVTSSGDIIFANSAATELLGRRETEILGLSLNGVQFRIDGVATSGLFDIIQNGGLPTNSSVYIDSRQVDVKLVPMPQDGKNTRVIILTDITERVAAEREMKRSLDEKQVLLKEVHHRVKNNLAMVASLITLQSGYLFDQRDVAVFEQLRNRIQSISLVHQQLYLSDDLANIDFASYARDLASNLMESAAHRGRKIDLVTRIEPGEMNINTAIPLGLIVAELLTNSLKYAFGERQHGTLTVELTTKAKRSRLTVSDDGLGLPAEVNVQTPKTLGFQIVLALSRQLGGRLRSVKGEGTTIVVEYPA
ncbi:MAG TPA: histidine kinase dimerization/phosphoacceptor domain -containing protein [Spirochaetia bacterium]|nr:histidine kinase dimerization/phosphoacceptor domain -containing protein [Spirochaetia bacterium]